MRSARLEKNFPNLNSNNYQITSPDEPRYNCVAWALGETSRWWQKFPMNGYHWPAEVATGEDMNGWMHVFGLAGYVACQDGSLENGFEKIAIYATGDDDPEHVARQLDSGLWTSKLGGWEDIIHHSLEALENSHYGTARVFMKRPKKQSANTYVSLRHRVFAALRAISRRLPSVRFAALTLPPLLAPNSDNA